MKSRELCRLNIAARIVQVMVVIPLSTSMLLAQVTGTLSVGPTGDYTSLTDAFSDITTNGLSGPVILELQQTFDCSVEDFSLVVSKNATSTNTITVRPGTDISGRIITSSNATATISLDSASYVTFDGRPGGEGASKQLTIQNTDIGSAFHLINGATHNNVRYCTVDTPNEGVGYFWKVHPARQEIPTM